MIPSGNSLENIYKVLGLGFSQFIGSCAAHHTLLGLHQVGVHLPLAHNVVMVYMTLVSLATALLIVLNYTRLKRDLSMWFMASTQKRIPRWMNPQWSG